MDDLPLPRLAELTRAAAPPKPPLSLVRLVRCLAKAGDGGITAVHAVASENYPNDPTLQSFVKAAIAAGSLGGDYSAIAPYRTMVAEFLQYAQPGSIVGRLDAARHLPLRVRIAKLTSSATVGWVGEGLSKPVTELAFAGVTLDAKKLAAIVIITAELSRFSSPSADGVIRQDLAAATNKAIDAAFVAATAATTAKPAGILNGVIAVTSTGSTPAAIATDIGAVLAGMTTAGGQLACADVAAAPRDCCALRCERRHSVSFADDQRRHAARAARADLDGGAREPGHRHRPERSADRR